MSPRKPVASHLITVQAARFVGVSQPVVTLRRQSGALKAVDVFGVPMFSVADLVAWKLERRRKANRRRGASTPDIVVEVAP